MSADPMRGHHSVWWRLWHYRSILRSKGALGGKRKKYHTEKVLLLAPASWNITWTANSGKKGTTRNLGASQNIPTPQHFSWHERQATLTKSRSNFGPRPYWERGPNWTAKSPKQKFKIEKQLCSPGTWTTKKACVFPTSQQFNKTIKRIWKIMKTLIMLTGYPTYEIFN